MISLHHYLD